MARPKKETPPKHSHTVMVRFSDVEYELVCGNAAQTGDPVAVYVRRRAVGEPVHISYNIVADISEIQTLAAEFGKIGNNLNQIARYFHTGGLRSQAMQAEINKCITELHDLRETVIKMAGDYRGNPQTHRR